MRIVVFDWEQGLPVIDLVLDDIAIQAEAPEGVFVGYLDHAVVWDVVRNRALTVQADKDFVTAVEYPSGDVETIEPVAAGRCWAPSSHG